MFQLEGCRVSGLGVQLYGFHSTAFDPTKAAFQWACIELYTDMAPPASKRLAPDYSPGPEQLYLNP